MKKTQIDNFYNINKEIEKEIDENFKSISLDKIIDLYSPAIVTDCFDDTSDLKEKINILITHLSNLITDFAIYDEKINKNIELSNSYYNRSIVLAILFILFTLLSFRMISIFLAFSTLLSLGIGFTSKILTIIYNKKNEKNDIFMKYVTNLLKGATIELKREENKDIINTEKITNTVKDEQYEILYNFNKNDLNIEVYDNENKDLVGNYKLTRHK